MSRRTLWTLAFSLVLHLILALLGHLANLSPPPVASLVQIEYREVPPATVPPAATSAHASTAKSPKSESRKAGRQSTVALRDLVPRGLGTATTGASDSGENGLTEEDWGAQGGKFQDIEHYNQYQRIFQEIEGLLYFPAPLGRRGITGTVNSRLSFDHNSHCDWRHSRVQGAHPYLRFYTLALLKKLCALENIEQLKLRDHSVDVSFDFSLTETVDSADRVEQRDGIVSNVLTFYRSYPKSILEYNIGPLRGMLFAPVLSIDFVWLTEHWGEYVNHQDPLIEFKEPQ